MRALSPGRIILPLLFKIRNSQDDNFSRTPMSRVVGGVVGCSCPNMFTEYVSSSCGSFGAHILSLWARRVPLTMCGARCTYVVHVRTPSAQPFRRLWPHLSPSLSLSRSHTVNIVEFCTSIGSHLRAVLDFHLKPVELLRSSGGQKSSSSQLSGCQSKVERQLLMLTLRNNKWRQQLVASAN